MWSVIAITFVMPKVVAIAKIIAVVITLAIDNISKRQSNSKQKVSVIVMVMVVAILLT